MHRIPRFFNHSDKRKNMDSKKKGRVPKLDRRLANKNIDYEPTSSWSSSSASSSASASSIRTRSLDVSPLGDRTSFRIQGTEGEMDLICQTLGFTGPEDFAIPLAEWEARKLRSWSDLLPSSQSLQLDSPKLDTAPPQVDDDDDGGANELCDGLADCVRVNDVAGLQCESVGVGVGDAVCELSDGFAASVRVNDVAGVQCESAGVGDDVCELSDRVGFSVRVSGVNDNQNDSPESVGCPITAKTYRGGGGGIKGVRPPVLAPPPSISLPFIDHSCSTWDILKSFAPDVNRDLPSVKNYGSSDDEEEEDIIKKKGVNGVTLGGTAVLSQSSSSSCTTNSNDDDSWSITTELMSNISPNDRFKRIITYWEKGQLLGSGSFGSVYEGIADGGFFIAVKQVSLLDQGHQGRQSILQLEQEIALLSQFEHENIVKYYGTDKDESNLYIFLELVTKGSLLNLYHKYNLQDSIVSSYTRQILHGLKYLHERNVVHRDIKCANILVHANGSVKLADFGLAKATKLNDVKSCKGTPFWMAPEVVKRNDQGYGLAADIWSLGCTVLEMLTRQIPYAPLESMQALFRIGRGEPPPVPDSLSIDARDFILRCLQIDPNARPTAAKLLDHPFVKRPLPSSSGSSSPYNSGRRV